MRAITFDNRGGTEYPTMWVPDGFVFKRPYSPAREGYLFDGWLVDGQDYFFDKPITRDVTFVARWIKAE